MAKKKSTRDSLSDILATNLNEKFKKQNHKVAYFLDGSDVTQTDLDDWVSTGDDMLDLAISNRPNGGFPVGRIVELTGLEASGKSLLAAHTLANAQKRGGLAVYIDTETAINQEFLQAIGVNTDELLYVPMDTVEDIFEAVDSIIDSIRSSSKDKLVTIVVDSVAAASTKVEVAGDYDQSGYATQKAIIISKALRKITNVIGRERILMVFTNQLRVRLGVSFGDPYTTSGGKALGFHASCRLRMKQIGKIYDTIGGQKQAVGIKTQVQVMKNRMGPPLRTVEFDIYFDRGIDRFSSWLTTMKNYKIVTGSGAWYTYNIVDKETGEVKEAVKFQAKQFEGLLDERPELKELMYKDICEAYILSYKDRDNNPTVEPTESE